MAAALFNFVVGLLGLISLGLLLFSIVLLVISFVRRSRRRKPPVKYLLADSPQPYIFTSKNHGKYRVGTGGDV